MKVIDNNSETLVMRQYVGRWKVEGASGEYSVALPGMLPVIELEDDDHTMILFDLEDLLASALDELSEPTEDGSRWPTITNKETGEPYDFDALAARLGSRSGEVR